MSDPTCTICLESITENKHVLEECGHAFHAGCIVKWFRSQANDRCPNCRGLPSHYLSYPDVMERYKMMRGRSRSTRAPKRLKRAVQSIKKTEAALKEAKRQVKEYRNEPETKACLKRVRDLETKTWRLEDRLSEKKRRLGLSNYDDGEFQLPHVVSSFY